MRFLHTADIHLKKGEEEGVEVLKWLIHKANELKVDLFIIAGDLFESDTDATILRPKLKGIFEQVNTKILMIPGNHDAKSYSKDYDYGKNVIQLTQTPFQIIKHSGLNICAVPYQDKKFSECIRSIPEHLDILIAHGTLYDESFIFSMIDDEETNYMPIYPANLSDIARYVALGHLHSRNIEKQYEKTKVIYPGSPLALDTKCVGKRFFYFVDIDKDKLKVEGIEVNIAPFWQEKIFFIFPGVEKNILNNIESYLNDIDNQNVMPNIFLRGFIGEKDKNFSAQIDAIKIKFSEKFKEFRLHLEIQSWDTIIQNRMVKNFVDKAMRYDEELRMKIFEITFPIFSDVLK
jgi:DNA repair exonuclease SbcCD nuclease subunit